MLMRLDSTGDGDFRSVYPLKCLKALDGGMDQIGPERLAKLEAVRKEILDGTIRPPMTQVQFDASVKAAERS